MSDSKSPKVTIAIPIYNSEKYLRFAIQSVLNQSYSNWILFLINDGSNDSSLSIMKEYESIDSRIVVINDNKNKGLIYRLNQSISMASTKYYARMDADDIMCISRIEKQVKYLEDHPEVDILGSSIMTIDNNNRVIGSGKVSGYVSAFVHPTVIGRTEWFRENLYSDWAHRAEDFELWTRTSSNSVFYSLDEPLLFYREFGVPMMSKTMMSYKTVLKIYRNYRTYNKPIIWFLKGSCATIIKIIICYILGSIGKMDLFVQMRRRVPLPDEKCLNDEYLRLCIEHN